MITMIELVLLFLLIAWLYAAFLWRSSNVEANTSSKPPVHFSWLPFLGPIFAIAFQGSNQYISSLWLVNTAMAIVNPD